ncbi:hypothetical protein FHT44_005047 [Mycolicibacterium sp. BK634]|uniref:hypothetical protein n=1 Tax=Mycolicibacterium sp. BK634 TaxID=2587099 RepID=UPI0016192951|nr:hypothetical protein [Mycolicibacterium sp. BK634]MBB3752535.1 hypothetical protein [Mycolicibacterium sp. BK634]
MIIESAWPAILFSVLFLVPVLAARAVFRAWDEDEGRSESQAQPAPLSVFRDASFFMPYVACPKCAVEALHWIAAPDFEAAVLTIERYEQRRKDEADKRSRIDDLAEKRRVMRARREAQWHREKCGCAPCYEREEIVAVEPANVTAARKLLELRPDVIRICRECKHKWPQTIGLPQMKEVAA